MSQLIVILEHVIVFKKLQMIKGIITKLFLTRLSPLQRTLKMIAIGLSKHQKPDTDPKSIQQTSYTRNLDQPGKATTFFAEDTKETTLESILNLFSFDIILLLN